MRGTLDTYGVVEVLQMLGRTRRSGTLHVECPQRQIDVHFVAGRIAETRDSTRVAADTVIGSQLLKRALVTEEQLAAALAEQEVRPRPVGAILVDHGALGEDVLRDVLSRQIANTLMAAKLEDSGTFVFVADRRQQPTDFVTIDTHAVLLEISTLGGEYCLAVEMIGRPSTVLVHNGHYETLPRNPLLMGRDEFIVLLQVDGGRTVKEITQASHLEEITVVSILAKLADAGVLLVKAERDAGDDGAAELQAHRESVWAEVSMALDQIAELSGPVTAPAGEASSPESSSPA